MKKINISKSFLIKEYKNKSTIQIAKEIGCSYWVILDRLKKFGIRIRTQSEAINGKNNFFYIDGRSLKKNYCPDCDKSIHWQSKRCSKCAAKKRINVKAPNYKDGRTNKKYYCKEKNCNNEICYQTWKYGKRKCRSCATETMWQDKKYREKTLRASMLGRRIKPNKPEKQLNLLLNKILPKEYKFVGDGKVIIDKLCPDFININGQKKIIELYGDYWHSNKRTGRTKKQEENIRIKTYKKYGYKTLIIWEHELKDLDRVKEKVYNFDDKKR